MFRHPDFPDVRSALTFKVSGDGGDGGDDDDEAEEREKTTEEEEEEDNVVVVVVFEPGLNTPRITQV